MHPECRDDSPKKMPAWQGDWSATNFSQATTLGGLQLSLQHCGTPWEAPYGYRLIEDDEGNFLRDVDGRLVVSAIP